MAASPAPIADNPPVVDLVRFRREAAYLREVVSANAATIAAASPGVNVEELIAAFNNILVRLEGPADDAVGAAIRRSRQVAVGLRVMERHRDALRELAK